MPNLPRLEDVVTAALREDLSRGLPERRLCVSMFAALKRDGRPLQPEEVLLNARGALSPALDELRVMCVARGFRLEDGVVSMVEWERLQTDELGSVLVWERRS